MNNFNIILITGAPGTGKTTLARTVAESLNLPLVSRDDIKAVILDSLGWGDRDWSKKIGKLSYQLMDYVIQGHLDAQNSLIVESAFNPQFENAKFKQWQDKYNFSCIQIFCYASNEVVLERWSTRASHDKDHPSYTEGQEGLEDLKAGLSSGAYDALEIKGSTIKVNTAEIDKIDTPGVINKIRTLIKT